MPALQFCGPCFPSISFFFLVLLACCQCSILLRPGSVAPPGRYSFGFSPRASSLQLTSLPLFSWLGDEHCGRVQGRPPKFLSPLSSLFDLTTSPRMGWTLFQVLALPSPCPHGWFFQCLELRFTVVHVLLQYPTKLGLAPLRVTSGPVLCVLSCLPDATFTSQSPLPFFLVIDCLFSVFWFWWFVPGFFLVFLGEDPLFLIDNSLPGASGLPVSFHQKIWDFTV